MIGYITMFITNIYHNVKKRRFLCFLLICQIWLSLFVMGTLVEQKNQLKDEQARIENRSESVTYYKTGELLVDMDHYNYCNDNGKNYEKLLEFHNMLIANKYFRFQTIAVQPLEIYSCSLPDIFLYGYETGAYEYSVQEYEGETIYRTKALQVSNDFFETFQIKINEGRCFEENDYKMQDTVPVLLGAAYKGYLEIGDKFTAGYLYEKLTFEVIGFINEEAFYYDDASEKNMVSLERYMLMPAQIPSAEDSSLYNRIALLQTMNGYVETDLALDEVNEIINNMLEEVGLDIPVFSVFDPDGHISLNDMFEQYSTMTKSVKQQFAVIVFLALVFVLLSMSFAIHGFLRENHYEYGVRLLNGASVKNIAFDMIGLIAIIVLLGDILAVMTLLMTNRVSSILMVQAVSLLVIVIVSGISLIHINRMNVSDIIGGKE